MALEKPIVSALQEEASELQKKIREVEEKISDLEDQRETLANNIDAILQVLKPYGGTFQEPRNSLGKARNFKDLSFRDFISETIKKLGKPVMPRDVEKSMLALGYTDDEKMKTPLRTRINNEMYKLMQAGRLARTDEGYMPTKG